MKKYLIGIFLIIALFSTSVDAAKAANDPSGSYVATISDSPIAFFNGISFLFSLDKDEYVIESDNPSFDSLMSQYAYAYSNGHGAWERVAKDEYGMTIEKIGYNEFSRPAVMATLNFEFSENQTDESLTGVLVITLTDLSNATVLLTTPQLPFSADKINYAPLSP